MLQIIFRLKHVGWGKGVPFSHSLDPTPIACAMSEILLDTFVVVCCYSNGSNRLNRSKAMKMYCNAYNLLLQVFDQKCFGSTQHSPTIFGTIKNGPY